MVRPYRIHLTEEQRAELRSLVSSGTAPTRLLTRARILLKADHGAGGPGWGNAAIALAVDVHRPTGRRIRRQFVTDGLPATLARTGPDRMYPRTLYGTQEAHLIALTCGTPPDRAGVLNAAAAGRSAGPTQDPRGRVIRGGPPGLAANTVKPHLGEQWCFAPTADPDFVAAMEDVLAVYERLYDPTHPVVCLDETSHQLPSDTRPSQTVTPGRVARSDPEHVRGGVANLFLVTSPFGAGAMRRSVGSAPESTSPTASGSWSTSTTPMPSGSCWCATSSTPTRPPRCMPPSYPTRRDGWARS